jgi:hypothetical protein
MGQKRVRDTSTNFLGVTPGTTFDSSDQLRPPMDVMQTTFATPHVGVVSGPMLIVKNVPDFRHFSLTFRTIPHLFTPGFDTQD